ncbi:osmoprotectant transport system permease protein [Frigoribacterium sp. PhB160]|uniref:ABC transporter permease n=1 Tax=Frigoribacterium sp. PhB160 TaxID=2485192 RepID=UPI000F4A4DDE|nr:ABC transporter permease [Frigoribacterium sp. PhB160]ROS62119.1 osmoprotectant transport system permease protein [Frigoribacterium sp. PhB160]
MNLFLDAFAWIGDPVHLTGPDGIPTRIGEHLAYTLVAVVIASVIAIPIGWLIGHTGRGRSFAVAVTGGARALPTVGLVFLLALLLGIGITAPMITFVILAVPSVLAGAYSGFEAVDRATVDAARAVGMTEWQIVTRVEAPLGLPLLIGGIRSATLQVVATATIASVVGSGGLGIYLFRGLRSNDYTQMLAGSILVILLAVLLEIVFSIAQRLVVPAGVTAGRPTDTRVTTRRSSAAKATSLQEGTQ